MGYPFGLVPTETISGVPDGIASIGTVGSSPNAGAASISTGVLTMQPADATHPGVVTAGTQTVGGDKTITGTTTLSGDVLCNGATGASLANFALFQIHGSVGSRLGFPAGGEIRFAQFAGAFTLNDASGGNYVTFDSDATKATRFTSNVGFSFPTTLSPSGTTQTVDWSTGSSQIVDAASTSGTLVLTFSNPTNGGRYVLETLGLTARLWTFPAAVKWAGGVAPTVTATTGAKDMFEFVYDGSDYVGRIFAQNVS